MNSAQHGKPIFYKDGQITPLTNVRLGDAGREDNHREEFLQRLIHECPDIIPMEAIEPAFRPLIPVCMELSTRAGSVDNLWITPEGGIVLGECKLIRNPQSRREVVAQTLDYAASMAGWHYDDLNAAAAKANKNPNFSIWRLAEKQSDLSESQFIDAIERRLRFGRLMLIIISDGLHEGMEALASSLQLHAGIHAGLALLDLSIWEGVNGGFLVVPRIPLKTTVIERGIVVIDGDNGRIVPPTLTGRSGDTVVSVTASEPEFYSQLEQRLPGLSRKLQTFVTSLKELGIEAEFGKSLFLRWQGGEGAVLSAGTIEPGGSVWFAKTLTDARSIGKLSAAEGYIETIAKAVNGTVERNDAGAMVARGGAGKSAFRLPALLERDSIWRQAIAKLVQESSL